MLGAVGDTLREGQDPRTSAPWKGRRWERGASCSGSAQRPLGSLPKVSGVGRGPLAGVSPHPSCAGGRLCRATPVQAFAHPEA